MSKHYELPISKTVIYNSLTFKCDKKHFALFYLFNITYQSSPTSYGFPLKTLLVKPLQYLTIFVSVFLFNIALPAALVFYYQVKIL